MVFRLPNLCIVCQADAVSIEAKIVRKFSIGTSTVEVFVDSLAAFKALISNVVKTKYLYYELQSLDLINHHQLEFISGPV